jgi:carotenoid isomerooxygenase
MSDNTFISINPLGRAYFCFYESPFMQEICPKTLETLRTVDLNKSLGILTNASHPHYDDHGNMISIGIMVGSRGPEYIIRKTEVGRDSADFDKLQVLASVRTRWALNPGYMHSFAVTDRFFVLIEQPLSVNVAKLAVGSFRGTPMIDCLRWRGSRSTLFHVVDRITGEELSGVRYKSKAFFYLHTINAYEDQGHVVLDVSCYESPDMLSCMYLEALQSAQSDPEYAAMFRGRPQRFVLPLDTRGGSSSAGENLVKLGYTTATATRAGEQGSRQTGPREDLRRRLRDPDHKLREVSVASSALFPDI